MSPKEYHFDTLQLHAGQTADPVTGSLAVPIYQTTSYAFENTEHGRALFSLEQPGNIYTRIMNPTTDVLEKRMAALEGGSGALAFASGMAAITATIQNLAQSGDEIITVNSLYGGTYTLFHDRLQPTFGIKAHLVNCDDFDKIESLINDKTRCLYLEAIGNPEINIPDFERLSALAHQHGLPVVVDNTFGTPYLIRLKDFGADIVVHSTTKYIGGHGTSIGGIIVDLGTFDWHNPRFPQFTQPDNTYHGLVYADLGAEAFITRARVAVLRDTGAALSPFNAFLLLQGLETLSLRVKRHCENAMKVAEYLQRHDAVEWVCYPALPGDKYYERAQKYFPRGVGAIFTFGIKGGAEAGAKFMDSLELFYNLANVADAKSLVIHPASTTHSQLDEEGMKNAGLSPEMVRISVGLEDARDIIADLEQALAASQA